jgi:hypothetical protein
VIERAGQKKITEKKLRRGEGKRSSRRRKKAEVRSPILPEASRFVGTLTNSGPRRCALRRRSGSRWRRSLSVLWEWWKGAKSYVRAGPSSVRSQFADLSRGELPPTLPDPSGCSSVALTRASRVGVFSGFWSRELLNSASLPLDFVSLRAVRVMLAGISGYFSLHLTGVVL